MVKWFPIASQLVWSGTHRVNRYGVTPHGRLTPAKAKKAAERAVDAWEQETRKEYQEEKKAAACGMAYNLPPEKRRELLLPYAFCFTTVRKTTI